MGIKLELSELKRITTRSQDINEELNSDLSKMATELDQICANIQSSELTTANQNLIKAINLVSTKVKTNFPQIIDFLNKQVIAYEQTNANTKNQIDNLVSSINSSFGNGNNNGTLI